MRLGNPRALIRYLGTKKIRVDSIKVDRESFKEALASKEAAALAESFEDVGMLQMPLVRKSDKLLVFGEHRLAGLRLKGGKRAPVEVRLCEVRDEDLEIVRLSENLVRRNPADRPALIRRMVEVRQALVMSDTAPALPEAKKLLGRPREPKSIAQAEVAATLGISAEAVRSTMQRSAPKAKPTDSPIVLLGLGDVPKEIVDRAGRVKKAVQTVRGLMVQAEGVLTRAAEDIPIAIYQRLHRAAAELAKDAADSMPVSICPYCKVVESLQLKCTACARAGFIVERQLLAVPRELLDEAKSQVVEDGKVRVRVAFNEPPRKPSEV